MLPFADIGLARRLERAEGFACAEFAAARARLFPKSGSTWIECDGAYAVFDGVDSPVTQTFGLGIFEALRPSTLDTIERFFAERAAPVQHEVCPLVGPGAIDLLCGRGYRPIEISNVTYRIVEPPERKTSDRIRVRLIEAGEARLWSDVSARGWAQEHPEVLDFLSEVGGISVTRAGSLSFLAELDGEAGAAGALVIHDGVALFGGSSTVPAMRRQGLQAALLEARMRYAHEDGCELAMMVAEAGSNSQRNAERKGFRIAYTRTKWRLSPDASRH